MATSMFSRRHYEAVAEVLRGAKREAHEYSGPGMVEAVQRMYADLFEADNEKFNRDKWEEACEHD
jgi:TPP-dependent pyruvate/acetoin dehydrogenase alpha subunit